MPALDKPASAPGAIPKPAVPKNGPEGEGGPPEGLPSEDASPKKKKSNWKLWLIAGGAVFFVVVMVVSTLFAPRRSNTGVRRITPTPTMVPLPTVPNFPLGEPSEYANDPQVLQMEGALKTFDRQLESVDLREQDLDVPELDMKVNFKK